MRLWSTFCRTCTTARHVCGVYDWWQSSHMVVATTISMMNVCCRIVPLSTSFCTVSFMRRRECGSVHTKPASMSLTLLSLDLLETQLRSSRDSSSQLIHCARGGTGRTICST